MNSNLNILFILAILNQTLAYTLIVDKFLGSSSSEEIDTSQSSETDSDITSAPESRQIENLSFWESLWSEPNSQRLQKKTKIVKKREIDVEEKTPEALEGMEKSTVREIDVESLKPIEKVENPLKEDPHRQFDKVSLKKRVQQMNAQAQMSANSENSETFFRYPKNTEKLEIWETLEPLGYGDIKPDFNASQKEFEQTAMENKLQQLKTQMRATSNFSKKLSGNKEKSETKLETWETLEPVGYGEIKPDFNVTEQEPNQLECCSCAKVWDESSILGSESDSAGRWNRNLYSDKNFTDLSFASENDPLNINQCNCNWDKNIEVLGDMIETEKEKLERCKRCCCIGMAVAATPLLTVGCGCGCGCGIAMAVPATPMMVMGCGCGCGGGYGY